MSAPTAAERAAERVLAAEALVVATRTTMRAAGEVSNRAQRTHGDACEAFDAAVALRDAARAAAAEVTP